MKEKDAFLVNMGKRIIDRRRHLSLSQESLAEMSGVTSQTISTAERGEKALRPQNLLKIASALGVSTDYLLTGELSELELVELTRKINSLPKDKIEKVSRIFDDIMLLLYEEE